VLLYQEALPGKKEPSINFRRNYLISPGNTSYGSTIRSLFSQICSVGFQSPVSIQVGLLTRSGLQCLRLPNVATNVDMQECDTTSLTQAQTNSNHKLLAGRHGPW